MDQILLGVSDVNIAGTSPESPEMQDLERLKTLTSKGEFGSVLNSNFAQQLSQEPCPMENHEGPIFTYMENLSSRDEEAPVVSVNRLRLSLIGIASFYAFMQSNVTGPPLDFSSDFVLAAFRSGSNLTTPTEERAKLIRSLAVDGVAAYRLVPRVELFILAKAIFNSRVIPYGFAEHMNLRIDFLHQRMLSEAVPSHEKEIYQLLPVISLAIEANSSSYKTELTANWLLERATIHLYYGRDKEARDDLGRASDVTGLKFALTGRLAKRTKFQQSDISQLVVLARSEDNGRSTPGNPENAVPQESYESIKPQTHTPRNLNLNDDTLLESLDFSKEVPIAEVKDSDNLPAALSSLDPAHQPNLEPEDAIILLLLASSITNTSPADGLTREETLPYATRVLDGKSPNWQIYTQALLVRSRIEGYRSRTQERGLLQLQALVDQIIVETSGEPSSQDSRAEDKDTPTTFLPRPTASESAAAADRLRYIHQLMSPTRWELEAELAARWVSLGGLKTAADIYERLESWAEVALCLAGLEEDGKAREILRAQLYVDNKQAEDSSAINDERVGVERDPLPTDAPRLFCVLGDLDNDPKMYERAWEVSGNRYARAQRSLGKLFFGQKDYTRSAEAYSKSLHINPLLHATWYALGCSQLQLEQWAAAADSFSRAVQIDDQDAESWSNLAAALVEQDSESRERAKAQRDEAMTTREDDPEKDRLQERSYRRDALNALKHAASLRYNHWRIWENVLTTAGSITPPAYADIVEAMRRLIEIRGPSVGESCIDVGILRLLIRDVILDQVPNGDATSQAQNGLHRAIFELMDKHVVPIITGSSALWHIVAQLALWRGRPGSSLEAQEKAWRAVTTQPGWEHDTEDRWNVVVSATVDLADAYETLGPMERTEGLGAGDGELVAKNWKFKAKTAIRGILGRGKASWEGTRGWKKLSDRLDTI
ncbi:MAG: hypothetical protein M1825_000917 [Sarcosagium campestre]|nr:MAG: hypothetical protein M1825_000917 [Sarcosagium campestre]